MGDSQVILAAIILLILIGIVAATLLQRKHRRTVWKKFARRRGMQYRETEHGPEAVGKVNGRAIRLRIVPESSDGGVLGMEQVELEIDLSDRVPGDLRVEPTVDFLPPQGDKSLTGELEKGAGFRVTLEADEERPVALSKSRHAALARLAEQFPQSDVFLTHGRLRLAQRTTGESLHELNRRLAALQQTADALAKPPERLTG